MPDRPRGDSSLIVSIDSPRLDLEKGKGVAKGTVAQFYKVKKRKFLEKDLGVKNAKIQENNDKNQGWC